MTVVIDRLEKVLEDRQIESSVVSDFIESVYLMTSLVEHHFRIHNSSKAIVSGIENGEFNNIGNSLEHE